jgi:hypothetical protein
MTTLRTHFAFRVDTWTTALCHIDALAEEVWNGKPGMGGDPTAYRKALTRLAYAWDVHDCHKHGTLRAYRAAAAISKARSKCVGCRLRRKRRCLFLARAQSSPK